MERSAETKQLMAALTAVQKELKNTAAKAKNDHHHSKYARLDHVLEEVRPLLAKNNLVLTQGTVPVAEAEIATKWILETTLTHSSGEFISYTMPLMVAKPGMQQLGSAITYARKFSINAMVGIADDKDDDGNLAAGRSKEVIELNKKLKEQEELNKTITERARSKITDLEDLLKKNKIQIPRDRTASAVQEDSTEHTSESAARATPRKGGGASPNGAIGQTLPHVQ